MAQPSYILFFLDLIKKKRKALQTGNYKHAAEVCSKIAAHYSESGEYDSALEEFTEERENWQRIGRRMEAASAGRMMGEMYMQLGEYEKALELQNKYLSVARAEKNDIEQQRAYATLGRLYLYMGESDHKALNLAEKMFLKALLVCKS